MLDLTHSDASNNAALPDSEVSVRDVFGLDTDIKVPAYSEPSERVPVLDPDYCLTMQRQWQFCRGLRKTGGC